MDDYVCHRVWDGGAHLRGPRVAGGSIGFVLVKHAATHPGRMAAATTSAWSFWGTLSWTSLSQWTWSNDTGKHPND